MKTIFTEQQTCGDEHSLLLMLQNCTPPIQLLVWGLIECSYLASKWRVLMCNTHMDVKLLISCTVIQITSRAGEASGRNFCQVWDHSFLQRVFRCPQMPNINPYSTYMHKKACFCMCVCIVHSAGSWAHIGWSKHCVGRTRVPPSNLLRTQSKKTTETNSHGSPLTDTCWWH